jgi:hypothetical protein
MIDVTQSRLLFRSGKGGPWGCDSEEGAMSEQPNEPRQPDSIEKSSSKASGTDSRQPGKVRTDGETSVDEAIGTGDNVH